MKKSGIFKKAGLLILVSIMILSSATGMMIKENQEQGTSEIFTKNVRGDYSGSTNDYVAWDNQMDYNGLLIGIRDEIFPLDAFPADDFKFENDTIIKQVNWIGGYWGDGYNISHWTWEIAFYEDDGSGNRPGDLYEGNFTFDVGNYTETLVQEYPGSIYYEISINLPESIMFNAGEKYWISIWAIGILPPSSGWGYHHDPIMLHEAVFKSYFFFNNTEWHNTGDEIVLNNSADMCFQLISEEIPEDTTPPTVEIITPGRGLYFRGNYIFPRFIRLTQIIGKITVEVNATDNESGINRVEFYYGPLGRKLLANDTTEPYSVLWKRDRLRLVHLHILKVVAYDNAGNHAHDQILVRKIW